MNDRPTAPLRPGAGDASLEPPRRPVDLPRRLVAEALGTAFLLAIVVGSGIMGDRLSGGSTGLALLANSVATGAGLVVLITVLGPLSGAHLNPAVTLVFALRRELPPREALAYTAAQAGGAVLGVWAAHLMFAEAVAQVSATLRDGSGQAFSEGVATFGLLLTILGGLAARPAAVPALVGLYIVAAYWFTASTSFANPAVTLARALTDSFAGIAPASVPAFLLAQVAGALLALAVAGWLLRRQAPRPMPEE
jgi:glycerol uptake facilitator-like aquaporin